jgi:hypothetical protein
VKTTSLEQCGLCGEPAKGFAMANGIRLCHADERSCYRRWTVYGERPLATKPEGKDR